jgi:FKBP-type peptidyl-prolyl cis-trans isomerase
MGVTKTVRVPGTGPKPGPGQEVTIEYTGWLKDTSKPDNKGQMSVDASDDTLHLVSFGSNLF